MGELGIKRVYEPADDVDGFRALVDRLWPRGVSKERARLDAWWKELAPSPALRTAWHHDPARFDEFADAYRAELDDDLFVAEALDVIRAHDRVTLLFAAHDEHVNHAAVLRDYLAARL
ncbi:DUF488 domain-containing protein [Protaetiibacter intestinalis]|uniref:DUF488 family protein n=1 Tax=Protaetiibacter intestinalis TaxID=2419774 RepID=A0A387B6I8_9MICO|nr:DUF488 family protein [Protaetiibacter intestinalis]AYF97368.1 DUF488 family protein [Protaetiibacter intestinalis]